MALTAFTARNIQVDGLDDKDAAQLIELFDVWDSRRVANYNRSLYYDTEQAFKDLGIALPPQLKAAKFYLGWPTQAVRKHALRTQFDGLRLPGSDDPFELGEVLSYNRFPLEFGQNVLAAGTHGFSLVTVSKDDRGFVQVQGHSAEHCAAVWDYRSRSVGAALTISEFDKRGPLVVTLWLPDKVAVLARGEGDAWSTVQVSVNPLGRVLAVAVTHDPQLRKPLGRSRITRSVMALTDMAVRTYVRMEGNAEFYSSPQLALLGLDESAFDALSESEATKFRLAMNRVIGFTRDSDGRVPELKQLSQATMQPHSDMLRTVAMAFSGETGIPPSSLGIIHDQPASAEAIRAAEHDLLIDATYHNRYVYAQAVKNIMALVLMVRDNTAALPDEFHKLTVRFVDPEFRSLSAQADAVQKLAAGMQDIAQWDVLLEQVFDAGQIARVKSDKRRSDASSFIDSVINAGPAGVDDAVTG